MLWTAFLLGVLGSLHCLGMCGPIVLTLPVYNHQTFKLISSRLLYNSGRILAYGLLGIMIGLVGEGIALTGFQQKVSILAGGLIIIFSVFSMQHITRKFNLGALRISSLIKKTLGKFLRNRGIFASLVVGFTNGFLPCGLVYLAVGGALATGSWETGLLYMVIFGAGTSIAMFTFGIAGNFLGLKVRTSFNKLIPYVAVFMGILLILRGLNLGIPYVSPMIDETGGAAVCH